MKIVDLKCFDQDYCLNVIDKIRLNWILNDCNKQESFKLTIYENDKVIFDDIFYTSAQYFEDVLDLKPLTNYKYTLTVNSDNGNDTKEGYFLSGLVNGFDSKSKWISDGKHFDVNQENPGTPALYFAKSFNIESLPKNSLVNICGLGFYVLKINGQKVGDKVLEPGFTQYDKEFLYSTYDIRNYLKVGNNDIEVILGEGWYSQSPKDEWNFYKAFWRGDLKLLFQLNLDNKTIVSDESWTVGNGEIISNAIRVGETHDFAQLIARMRKNATVIDSPEVTLKPSYLPPIKEVDEIVPTLIKETNEHYIFDCGKNMAGYAKVLLKGNKGDKVKVTYSDRLTDDKCDNKSNSMYIYNKDYDYQTDIAICSGNDDFLEPLFVYHGFRYITVTKNAEIKDIKAYFVHTDLKRTGSFNCSYELLNRYYDMTIQSILSNYHSIPTDCPHREKNGWTGDAQLSMDLDIYSFDMFEAYRKWLQDIVASQRENGEIPCIVPTSGWGFDWGNGPAWDIAFFRISYALYYYYGSLDTVFEMYPHLVKYFEYISSKKQDDLVNVGLSDWNYPKNIEFRLCPGELTCSCYYLTMAEILKEFATLCEPEAVKDYDLIINKTKTAILNKYKEENSLTGLAALTYFGLEDHTNDVVDYLINNDFAPHMGILGTKYVCDVLGKAKRTDLLVKLLERKDYPCFRYWMDHGQTTLCEDFELTNSLNHHMFSPIVEMMPRYICGIEVLQNGGVCFSPALPEKLDFAEASITTTKGLYKFKVNKDKVVFDVPANGLVIYKNKEYSFGQYEI